LKSSFKLSSSPSPTPVWFFSFTFFHYNANSKLEEERDSTCFQKKKKSLLRSNSETPHPNVHKNSKLVTKNGEVQSSFDWLAQQSRLRSIKLAKTEMPKERPWSKSPTPGRRLPHSSE
jgi:hypothetical protein